MEVLFHFGEAGASASHVEYARPALAYRAIAMQYCAFICQFNVLPNPATHVVLTPLKGVEAVHQTLFVRVPKIMFFHTWYIR